VAENIAELWNVVTPLLSARAVPVTPGDELGASVTDGAIRR
jgi:hypothetical protein